MNIEWKYYLRENGEKHWYIECEDMPSDKPIIARSFKDDEKSIEEQLKAIL